jgi:Transposase DDE domain group 1
VRESATPPLSFPALGPVPLEVDFLGGRLTSDGGLAWIAEADAALGVTAALAAVIPDWRRRRGRHDLATLVAQRVYQIACGYEDQGDADALRTDPLLKHVCGRVPESGPDLASRPTLSRLENAIGPRTCYRLAAALGEVYLRERERDGVPGRVVLDLDGTDDPPHGAQEGSAYHGHYRQHQYFPLLVFGADTDQLVTAVLRPGTVHAGHGVVAILKRIVAAIRARWPGVTPEARADSGFAVPALHDCCDAEGIAYTIGLAPNPRLDAAVADLQAEAHRQSAARDGGKVRRVGETSYQAAPWPRPRRVVMKAEVLPKGPNTRFVVTSRADDAGALYDWYVERGGSENWIKDLKSGCFAGRLSGRRFWANQVRLLLHATAYCLLDALRRRLQRLGAARMTLETIRLRLLKVGGWVRERRDRVRLRLAASHPSEARWRALATRHPLHE